MSNFKGFTEAETFTQLPDSFFRTLLRDIKDADELKVTLYVIWRIVHLEAPFRAVRESDINAKELGLSEAKIKSGLRKAVERGSLLEAQYKSDILFFLNSPRGRAAAQEFSKGQLQGPAAGAAVPLERPNIFRLYEENIGALTPLIADTLKDAEETYSPEWIGEAIELAVKNNKRNWKYCEAILKRWKEEGRAQKQDGRDPQKDRRRYVEGDYADYVEH